eukprot:scaffold1443_cov113-Cylindrotheca_fusiformis.AAC.7
MKTFTFLLFATAASAFTVERRNFCGQLAGAAAVMAIGADQASAKSGPFSVFSGEFDDPNHPGNKRKIKVVGKKLEVTGNDGQGDWKIQGKMKSDTEAVFDFSGKGGPSELSGTFDGDGILFSDGNKWGKAPTGNLGRRS